METILKFLRENYETDSVHLEKSEISIQKLKNLNQLFTDCKSENQSKNLILKPRIEKNQIWSVKSKYEDFLGVTQKSFHPIIVLILNDPDEIQDEQFIRVDLISPFIEFAAFDDLVCPDSSIIGFPFLIETWNEQPLLSEILDEYLGYYKIETSSLNKKNTLEMTAGLLEENSVSIKSKLNNFQLEFRNIEVSRAKYLNNSVMALLSFLENRQTQDSGVVISLNSKPQFPKFFIGDIQKEPDFALAAKSGFDTEDKFIHYKTSDLPFELFIRKNNDGFIITISPLVNIKLFTSDKKELHGISNAEKTVFHNLKKGLYFLTIELIKEPIKIRLK